MEETALYKNEVHFWPVQPARKWRYCNFLHAASTHRLCSGTSVLGGVEVQSPLRCTLPLSGHVKKLTNNAFIGNTGHFDNETDSAGSEGLEDIDVDHIKPLCRPQAEKSDVYLLPKHIDAGSWYSHRQLCVHVACGRVVVMTRLPDAFDMNEMVTGVRVSSHRSPSASWAPSLFGGFVRGSSTDFPRTAPL